MNSFKLNHSGSQPVHHQINLPNTTQGKLIVTPYNQHDAFEGYRNDIVTPWQSWIDVLMNFLRGIIGVKVHVLLEETIPGYYRIQIYDINNTGTTPEVLVNQVLYVVNSKNRVDNEGGVLSVHGQGWDRFFGKMIGPKAYSNGQGITAITQREGSNNNQIFAVNGFNPYDYGTDNAIKKHFQENYNHMDEIGLDFEDGYKPYKNFLYLNIPNVVEKDILGIERKRPMVEILADLISTYFFKALDDKNISFHLRQHDLGTEPISIDVTEGAKFFDEYGNILSYHQLEQEKISLCEEHEYEGRFLQSCKLTSKIEKRFKDKEYRLFGHIPDVGLDLHDGWLAWVLDGRPKAGVVLASYGTGDASGAAFCRVFIETEIKDVITSTEKGKVLLPSSDKMSKAEAASLPDDRKILGKDGNHYHPRQKQPTKKIIAYCKEMNPKLTINEITRRNTVWAMLQRFFPYKENGKETAINRLVISQILKLYKMDNMDDIKEFILEREWKVYDGLAALDLGLIIKYKEDGKEDLHIANEWKQKESQIKVSQLITEITGWLKREGKLPDIFIISADAEGKEDSMTIDGGFLPISKKKNVVTLRERVAKLKSQFPTIEFVLMDTNFLGLNKNYSNFSNNKKESLDF